MRGHSDIVVSVKYSQDGKKIISGGRDKKMFLWNSDKGQIISVVYHHIELIFTCFSLCGRNIISCAKDNTIKIWRL